MSGNCGGFVQGVGLEDEVDECGREDGRRGGEERATHGSAELELKVSSD